MTPPVGFEDAAGDPAKVATVADEMCRRDGTRLAVPRTGHEVDKVVDWAAEEEEVPDEVTRRIGADVDTRPMLGSATSEVKR